MRFFMISIIIPVYNAEFYLEECLDSIKSQSHPDFEVLCVNDGSTDRSEEICERYVREDKRFRLYSQENSGVSVARNLGIEQAQGEYLCFVDSDDVIANDFLRNLLDRIQGCDASACDFSNNLRKLGKKEKHVFVYKKNDFIKESLLGCRRSINVWLFLFKRSIILMNHIRFVEGCIRNEDTEFYIRYMTFCSLPIVWFDYVGYYYRAVDTSAMATFSLRAMISSLGATERMNELLYVEQILSDKNFLLTSGVIKFLFLSALQSNRECYDYLHSHYDVKSLLNNNRSQMPFSRQVIALLYRLLGKGNFWRLIGLLGGVQGKRLR